MHYFVILFFLFLTSIAQAQQVGDLFKTMPTTLLPGLSDGNKTMLLVDTGRTTIPYAFGEITKEAYSTDYLKLKTSNSGTLQLKLLPISEDSQVICLIQTVCAGICDSRISFYTIGWEKLDRDAFLPPFSEKIFLNSSENDSKNDKYAVSLPDINPISASFDKTGTDLTLTYHYKQRLTGEQIEYLKTILKGDSVVLTWNKGTFR
jgi:hypothetical protein